MDNIKYEQDTLEKSMVNLNEILIKIKQVEERAIENLDELNKLYDLYRTLRACYLQFSNCIQRLRAIPIHIWTQNLMGKIPNLDELTNYLKRVDAFFKKFQDEMRNLPKLYFHEILPIVKKLDYNNQSPVNNGYSFPTMDSMAKTHLKSIEMTNVAFCSVSDVNKSTSQDKFIDKPVESCVKLKEADMLQAENGYIIHQDDSLNFCEPKDQCDDKNMNVHNDNPLNLMTKLNYMDINSNVHENELKISSEIVDPNNTKFNFLANESITVVQNILSDNKYVDTVKLYTEFNKADVNNIICVTDYDTILRRHLDDILNVCTVTEQLEEIDDINADNKEPFSEFTLSYGDNPSKRVENKLATIIEDKDSTTYSDSTTEQSITNIQNIIKSDKFVDDVIELSNESAVLHDAYNNMICYDQPEDPKLVVDLNASDTTTRMSTIIIQNFVKDDKFIDDLIEVCIGFNESSVPDYTYNNVICYDQTDDSNLDVDLKDKLSIFAAVVDEIHDKNANEDSLPESCDDVVKLETSTDIDATATDLQRIGTNFTYGDVSCKPVSSDVYEKAHLQDSSDVFASNVDEIVNYCDSSTINVDELETTMDIFGKKIDLQDIPTNSTFSDVSCKFVSTAVHNFIENELNLATELKLLTLTKSENDELGCNANEHDDEQLEFDSKTSLNTIQDENDLRLQALIGKQLPIYSNISDPIEHFGCESYSNASSFIELNSCIEDDINSNASTTDTEILLAFEPDSHPLSEPSSECGFRTGEESIITDSFSDLDFTSKTESPFQRLSNDEILSLLEEIVTISLENVEEKPFQVHPLYNLIKNQWKHVMVNNTIDIKLIQAYYVNDFVGYCRFITNAADLQDQNFIRIVMVGNEIAGIELLN